MRKAPGLRRATSNRKLFMVHKDLQKQCDKRIKQHEVDVRIQAADIRQKQTDMERRHETLVRQQKHFDRKRQKTHAFLEQLRQSHVQNEVAIRRFTVCVEQKIKPGYIETIRSIGKMPMPNSMKERLRHQYTVNSFGE
ncbi:hypothetical protein LSH36_173g09008 [Paralvinella palmiformis]|uniref:Uncharacterized protein n=1 Tax=Paralvinella palmiformis TaxID=53620 RepID=A0AAD9JRW9_9ANNE|nr:hypothetical protein LSH36_173g09008 [Paralvinella palmiformis]